MKKYRLIAAAGLFLLGACSRGTGSVELRNETDSVAYVIGLNVGYNLQRMDSTLNVEAVCQAVRDVYARTARMTPDQARAVYLRYVKVSQPRNRFGPMKNSFGGFPVRAIAPMPRPIRADVRGAGGRG